MYLAIGSPIVTTFVIPSICLVSLVFDAVVMLVFRENLAGGYMKYLLLSVALGLVPLALVAAGLTTTDIPSYTSALAAAILLLALLTFWREPLWAEVRKLVTM